VLSIHEFNKMLIPHAYPSSLLLSFGWYKPNFEDPFQKEQNTLIILLQSRHWSAANEMPSTALDIALRLLVSDEHLH